jgi:endonuclease YncB( thermonuclease family)
MKHLPFIGSTKSKLLLIGSTTAMVVILVLTVFMSLANAEAQFSTAVPESNLVQDTQPANAGLTSEDPAEETLDQSSDGTKAAIVLPPIEEATSSEEDAPAEEIASPEPILAIEAATCIPNDSEVQTGSVIEVVDTDSLSVMIDDTPTTVRYLGIDTHNSSQSASESALMLNKALIGQSISLVADAAVSDRDGALVRYVFTDDVFINQHLLEAGLATLDNTSQSEACFQEFQTSQELARSQKVGTWEPLKPEDWRQWPIVPEISANAFSIYLRGLGTSVNPETFSIVGDCLSIPERLFRKVSWGDFELPEGMEDLQSTVDQFTSVWNRQPVTVEGGFVPASVFSSYFSDTSRCEPFETPLNCEFRINNPSIVIISIGTDQKPGTEEEFEFYMREIIDYSIERDVLPIIATKADPNTDDFPLNHIMAELAYEYDIPLWNFWAAVQHLPNTALNPVTGIHLTAEGNEIRRLSALQVLHAVLTAAEAATP